jgi:type IV pilus assembly protein PilM
MVDLHKEVKLSDLVPKLPKRNKPAKVKPVATVTTPAKRKSGSSELVGLKIEAGSVTAAHVVDNGSRKLLRIAQAPLGAGIVNGGEVRDPAALATVLGDFFRVNALPKRGVRLGLANSRIGVRVVEVSGVADARQLDNAVGFRAHEILSSSLDEAVLDYHVLDTTANEEGELVYRVLLVIAYRDSVDRYLAATDAAGLEVSGVDLEAFALLRAAMQPRGDDGPSTTATVAVAIDYDLTTLAVSDGVVCQFTRVLEWGTGNVDTSLHRTLKVPLEEAEQLRATVSLEAVPEVGLQGMPTAADVVRRELQTLVRELQSSIRFYGSQPGAAPVGSLVVSGALVDIPGFVKRLGADLNISTSAADPFGRVELGPDVSRPDRAGGLVVAVGLGIED